MAWSVEGRSFNLSNENETFARRSSEELWPQTPPALSPGKMFRRRKHSGNLCPTVTAGSARFSTEDLSNAPPSTPWRLAGATGIEFLEQIGEEMGDLENIF
jgi:hypothetical protein